MTDNEFLAGFVNCTIPRAEWSHEAHVRMAWLYLRQMPYDEAVALVRAGIQRYNHTVGSGQGYHETVTVAFVRLIDARVNRDANAGEKFPDFLARCPELVDRERPILHEYYRPETLDSDAARDSFVEPDRSPLP